ncbi:hypothetical protein Leryth_013228 [Lithospermum erythrorhizon]|nr:hypothetical protein Leryth_013228 [Lithospermum erythrorhizon]
MLIPQINIRTRNWTCRITIIEDISILTVTTGLRIKRYVLADDEENQVSATIFGSHIPILSPRLQLFTVHEITNAQVRFVETQYRIVDNQYQWVLQRDTLIRPIPDAVPNLSNFLNNLTPISVVIFSNQCGRAKSIGFSTYNGTSLAARNNTSFTINPPIETALNFKSWVESRTGPELRAMLVDQSLSRSKQRVDEGTETVHSVAELQNMTKGEHYDLNSIRSEFHKKNLPDTIMPQFWQAQ